MAKPTLLPIWNENETNNTVPDSTRQNDGWIISGGVPQKPQLEYMNWYQWNVYKWVEQFNQQGVVEWDATTTYQSGDLTKGSNGYIYQSRIGANLNNNPTTSPAQWKLGFRNPYLVLGNDTDIDSGRQLQVINASSAAIEMSTTGGATRQRLTLSQTPTEGSIQSYDENGSAALPLELNPAGGTVKVGNYIINPTISVESHGDNLAISVYPGTSVLNLGSITDNIAVGSQLTLYVQVTHISGGTQPGVFYANFSVSGGSGNFAGPDGVTGIAKGSGYIAASGATTVFIITMRWTTQGNVTWNFNAAATGGGNYDVDFYSKWDILEIV